MNMAILNNPMVEEAEVVSSPGNLFYKYGISLLLFLLIVVLVVWAGILISRPDILPVKNVRIEGEFRQLYPDRLQATVIDTVRGGFFNINVGVIKRVLLEEPWVQQVSVRRIWPDTITVTISEREAVARWGSNGLISKNGEYFEPESYDMSANLPLLDGPDNSHDLVLQQFRTFALILAESGQALSQLELNERRSWTAQLTDGPHLILGQADIQARMQRFIVFVNSSMKSYLQEIDTVDLRYTNGFAVRWKVNPRYTDEIGLENHGQES